MLVRDNTIITKTQKLFGLQSLDLHGIVIFVNLGIGIRECGQIQPHVDVRLHILAPATAWECVRVGVFVEREWSKGPYDTQLTVVHTRLGA